MATDSVEYAKSTVVYLKNKSTLSPQEQFDYLTALSLIHYSRIEALEQELDLLKKHFSSHIFPPNGAHN